MTKTKIIKTATLEKRFEKLHNAQTMQKNVLRLLHIKLSDLVQWINQTFRQRRTDAIDEWCQKFARLGSDTQKVESQYFEHLQNDNTECELIEDVPNYSKNGYATPDAYQVEAKFFEIGYYKLEGDPYSVSKHNFSNKEIIDDIKFLQESMVFFIKTLANVDYKGVWNDIGEIIKEIYKTAPNNQIANLMAIY